jgi:hypothetical protein
MRRTWVVLALAVAMAAILGSVGVAVAKERTTAPKEGTTAPKDSAVKGPGILANGGLRLTNVSPQGGATGVSTTTTVRATFNKPLDPATIESPSNNFKLKDKATNAIVPATVVVSSNDPNSAKLKPTSPLSANHTYKASIEAGNSGVTSTTGDELTSVNTSKGIKFNGTQAEWSFKVK